MRNSLGDAFVSVRTTGHQDAWQGGAKAMADRLKREVEGFVDGIPPEFTETVPVTYSPGCSEPVPFDFSRENITVTVRE